VWNVDGKQCEERSLGTAAGLLLQHLHHRPRPHGARARNVHTRHDDGMNDERRTMTMSHHHQHARIHTRPTPVPHKLGFG